MTKVSLGFPKPESAVKVPAAPPSKKAEASAKRRACAGAKRDARAAGTRVTLRRSFLQRSCRPSRPLRPYQR